VKIFLELSFEFAKALRRVSPASYDFLKNLTLLVAGVFCLGFFALASAADKHPAPVALTAASLDESAIWLLWHGDVLASLKLDIQVNGEMALAGDGSFVTLPVRDAKIRAAPGRFDALEGSFDWPYDIVIRRFGRQLRLTELQLLADDPLRLAIRDADQRTWLMIGAGHPRLSADRKQLNLSGAELRIGPALAEWLGAPLLFDQPLANVLGRFPLLGGAAAIPIVATESCTPRWPGTLIDANNPALGRYRADVRLIQMTPLRFLRCRQIDLPNERCDGPAGVDGEVALAPDAVLQNSDAADAADVPWYSKFLGVFPPDGNDQHPFLIWNLYRADPNGYLLQIGRSGLKHAFITINNGCTLGCSPPAPANANNVLYPSCSDVYSVGSNDTRQFLGPRSELIPSVGLWARCGSVFDPNCDGVEDQSGIEPYQQRLLARETAIDPAVNPLARYFSDAWYVVRGDVDIDNTMGTREVQPSWAADIWNFPFIDNELQGGPMVARWVAEALNDGSRSFTRRRLPQGEIALGARVERIGPSLWRYRYVLANLDFARVTTSGALPNLRLDSEHGVGAFALPLLNASASDLGFRDGDALAGNDWNSQLTVNELRFIAPQADAELRWGNLLSFGFDSASPPGYALASVELGIAGQITQAMPTLVPGGELFFDGFE